MSRKPNRFTRHVRKAKNKAIDAIMLGCGLLFAFGLYQTGVFSGTPAQAEQVQSVPFNSALFFTLFAAPILLSLGVAIGFFAVQQYRASNGTRDRGWEELW